MEFIAKLWLPMLLSAVAVWLWALLACTILALHKKDWKPLPNDDAFANALRPLNLLPGVYCFPYFKDFKHFNDPAFQARWNAGPNGIIHVWRASQNMGATMLLSFLVYLVASFFIAYAGYAAMGPIVPHSKTFQVIGAMGVLAYSFAGLPNMIWFQANPRAKVTAVIDGIIMGLITGAIFAALWPATITIPGIHL